MRIAKLIILTITVLIFITSMAIAADFYGATVTDKDVPSSYMKYGIYGQRSIIGDVSDGSPASKAGFKHGNIILTINDEDVKRTSQLDKFTTNTLSVYVFNGIDWKILTIDRLAIETEKARRLAAGKKPASVVAAPLHKRTYTVTTRPDNSPPLKFDNAALDKKYGKTSPAEFARQRQIAESSWSAEQDQLAEAERARSQSELKAREAEQNAQLKKMIEQTKKMTEHRVRPAERTVNVPGVNRGFISPVVPEINNGAINTSTGEFLAPAGNGYTGTRDGTYYTPAGPNGIIDTRTGQFLPMY